MGWGFSRGRFAEICEHLVHKGGDAERLAPVSAWRLTCLGTARAAPHAATVDSACLGGHRSQVGPAAGDVTPRQVLGTWVRIQVRTTKNRPPAAPSCY